MGYAFQFVTLAGFHALNFSMFELASGYAKRGMASYAELQEVRGPAWLLASPACMHCSAVMFLLTHPFSGFEACNV